MVLLVLMSLPNTALTALTPPILATPDGPSGAAVDDAAWRDAVQLLRRAAELAATTGAETDRFMEAAWAACLEARPGLREQLEDKELRAQLKKLRKRGLVASA
jgi:hypothetical protein